MPLLKFHILPGRSDEEIDLLLDTAHAAMVRSFKVPERDRYQIVNEHRRLHFRAEDTGLGIDRTEKFVLVEVVSRPRSENEKTGFYQDLAASFAQNCGIPSSDLMISFVENSDRDWSFGHGQAQFLTGDL